MGIGIGSSLFSAYPVGLDEVTKASPAEGTSSGFGDVLKGAITDVTSLQSSADQQVSTLMQGGQGDMSKTMISVEKADVAFQLMLQVRNKVVSAYQDIEKMQF